MFWEMWCDGYKFVPIDLFTPHLSLSLAAVGQYVDVNNVLSVKPLVDVQTWVSWGIHSIASGSYDWKSKVTLTLLGASLKKVRLHQSSCFFSLVKGGDRHRRPVSKPRVHLVKEVYEKVKAKLLGQFKGGCVLRITSRGSWILFLRVIDVYEMEVFGRGHLSSSIFHN